MDKNNIGAWGEKKAAEYLRKMGYKIVEMNFSTRFGEIDIIAQDKGYIVFAEVKLRKDARFGQAREFVTRAKQQKLITTAQLWLQRNESCSLQPRFDVIEIYAPHGRLGSIELNHLENAF